MVKSAILLFFFGVASAEHVILDNNNQCGGDPQEWRNGNYWTPRDFDGPGSWAEDVPQENFHVIVQNELHAMPKKQDGKKRITILGDSLATDDLSWGWAPHLGYELVNKQLPFDVINLARGLTMIAPQATYEQGDNCFNVKLPDPIGLRQFRWQLDDKDWARIDMLKQSQPDIVILQIGVNDMTPACMTSRCFEQKSGYIRPTEKPIQPSSTKPDCFHKGTTEEGQFKIIHDEYIKLIELIKGLESKPQVFLLSPLPLLGCCPDTVSIMRPAGIPFLSNHKTYLSKEALPIVSKRYHTLVETQKKVAQETGIPYVNVFDKALQRPEQELCDMQQFISGPGACNPVHYGRDMYMEALMEQVINPSIAQSEQIATETKKILASAQEKIASASVHSQIYK